MAKRKIKLLVSHFSGYKLSIKREVIATVTVVSQFDQVAAEALEIHDELYDKHGATAKDVHQWSLGLEFFGASLRIMPRQATTDGQVRIDGDGVLLPSLHAHSFSVKKPQDEGGPALRITFKADLLDSDGKAHKLIHGLKQEDFDLVLELANLKAAEAAKELAGQAGLFGRVPKDEADGEEPEEAEE